VGARYLHLHISPELSGKTVDTLLRKHLELSGTVIRRIKWLEDGITVDGKRVTVRHHTCEGEILSVRLTDPVSADQPVPTEGILDIVYEDEDMVVVNKQPGILIHPSHGHFDDTIGNYLMWHWGQLGEESGFHPVHRLDKGTTGLLIVAKHPHGQEKLKNQLHTGDFRRRYLAVCEGCPQPVSGTIDAAIAPVEGSLIAREIRADGQPARTHYRVLSTQGGRALVELGLETGRTHQIRVHMAHIGHPLTGDFLYGTEDKTLIPRPALHSWQAEITHPITGVRMTFTAPIPLDMKRLIEKEF
jgi:23S rRNA pseudouridine1911/1915/1917 synthase